ncbi:MAG: TIGR00341 family protein [Bacteroidetes bacterium]|nr:TIGR00341 family protein [Bacteroidota bacterium]MBK9800569.1 TIGR00341 family protein [Bacteroidota bacterium]
MNILDHFRLNEEKEEYEKVIATIDAGVTFKGTNLWVLVFAIFIASLGLNVNSTAVIIGAMLVSPLMGPIMGLGMGMAINDLSLLKKALYNYLFAGAVGLATSTLYFFVSPINDAHSEILARTSPTIYDVLIAFFGGLAGILATSSRQKGNVIPGVAISTALMPPLCTAGYGLATLQFSFFFGAFYLFIINTVFIALATLITTRLLKFPFKHLLEKKDEIKAKRIVWVITLITVLPSIYLGYDIVQQNKFIASANRFIENEAVFPNDYLLKKHIDTKHKTITLIYGGQYIEVAQINLLRNKLPNYNIDTAALKIQQGFAYLKENKVDEVGNQMLLKERENQIQILLLKMDSLNNQRILSKQIFKEVKTQYPIIQSVILQPVMNVSDSLQNNVWLAIVKSSSEIDEKEKIKIQKWMLVRLNITNLKVIFEE